MGVKKSQPARHTGINYPIKHFSMPNWLETRSMKFRVSLKFTNMNWPRGFVYIFWDSFSSDFADKRFTSYQHCWCVRPCVFSGVTGYLWAKSDAFLSHPITALIYYLFHFMHGLVFAQLFGRLTRSVSVVTNSPFRTIRSKWWEDLGLYSQRAFEIFLIC